jgi:hypothetical protein
MGVDSLEREWGDLKVRSGDSQLVKKVKEVKPPLPISNRERRKQLHVENYVDQQLGLDIWDWDQDRLIALSIDLAFRCGLHRILRVSLANFSSYLYALADQYVPTNSYHNFTHATDVLLMLCHMLLECRAAIRMTEYEVAACFLAAHAHDVGHPGTNNRYQVAAKTSLGEKYGSAATLETYSADLGKELLCQHHILDALSSTEKQQVLSTFRSSILGTDMAEHHTTVIALRHLPDDFYTQNYPQKRPGRTQYTNGNTHALSLPALILHASDISGPTRQTVAIWLTRSLAVTREFVSQGDCERANHIPVTESFDRLILMSEGLDGFQRRENEFTRGLVLPYYREVERVWNGIRPLREAIEENLRGWDELDREAVTKLWGGIFV